MSYRTGRTKSKIEDADSLTDIQTDRQTEMLYQYRVSDSDAR